MDGIFNHMRAMFVFARVVEANSFTGAARHLGLSRAVVSYQIKTLESQLGVRLLHRSTRKLSLTSAGQRFYQRCQRIADEATRAHHDMETLRGEAVGRVRIACPVNLGEQWVIPVVDHFCHQHPGVELDIRLSEDMTDVIEQGVDLALRAGPLPDSELLATRILRVKRHLCAAPDYVQRHGWPRHPTELTQHQWVVYERGSAKAHFQQSGRVWTIPMQGRIRTNNARARLQFVLSGHGLALLPDYDIAGPVSSGKLAQLLGDFELSPLEVFAVFPKGATDTRAVQLLLESLKQAASEPYDKQLS